MITRLTLTAVLAGCFCGVGHVHAQNVQRVQPIVLTASPVCCQSPAASATAQVALPCGDRTYLSPEDRDPVRVIPVTSQLVPLPRGPEWRGYQATPATYRTTPTTYQARPTTYQTTPTTYQARPTTVTGYPETVTTLPPATTSVRVLRPIVTVPPAPTVPEGHVVGKGLIGQPKLYIPGQPVRNFLRYITL
jgi:hypothetical protein